MAVTAPESAGASDGFTAADLAQAASCALVPSETEGPYPLLDVLGEAGIVRRDITVDRSGVALTLALKLVDVDNACAPIANAAVYIWHCDAAGVYSGYAQPGGVDTRGLDFLRGVQLSNQRGVVVFKTIYPGWYAGRITHIHFQVYLNDALGVPATATSQLALPQDITRTVYDSALYSAHGQNTSVRSFSEDNVFSDGTTYQMLRVRGSVADGYQAARAVGIMV
jgi:protocatechuate 3,4-dioxygenase beta subunit